MKPFRLTCPRFVATCSTSCGCPTRACPGSNGFVADLPAYDFGTLRFEILRRVPETLIPDHRLRRPESATPGPGKLGSTLRRYSGALCCEDFTDASPQAVRVGLGFPLGYFGR